MSIWFMQRSFISVYKKQKTHHKAVSMQKDSHKPFYGGLISKHCEIPEIHPATIELENQDKDATLCYILSMNF